MDAFLGSLFGYAVRHAPTIAADYHMREVEKQKVEVFIEKAKIKNILVLNKPCDNKDIDEYMVLYKHLIKVGVIYEKPGIKSLFNTNRLYYVNDKLINPTDMKEAIDKDMPDSLKCYDINYNVLYEFIKNYRITHTSKIGGKSRKSKMRKRPTRKYKKL